MKMADMTFADVRSHLNTHNTLIIPVGTCEQQGYHLPLNNDILCVEYFADILSSVQEHDIPFSIFEDYLFHRVESEPVGYVGNLGFPSAASSEKGKILVEHMIEKMMADFFNL